MTSAKEQMATSQERNGRTLSLIAEIGILRTRDSWGITVHSEELDTHRGHGSQCGSPNELRGGEVAQHTFAARLHKHGVEAERSVTPRKDARQAARAQYPRGQRTHAARKRTNDRPTQVTRAQC